MYLHTPAVEAGSWWRVDTASGSDTGTTVYAYDGTGPIPNYYVLTGSTVRNTSWDGTARFWSATATLYLKELTYQGVPNGTVVTSTGVTPAAPVGGAPVDIATISTTVAALPTTYAHLLTTDATSTSASGTLAAWHLTPVDATGGAATWTLPAASSVAAGVETAVKKADTSANTVTASRAGSDLIFGTGSGATSKVLTLAGEAITFVSNGVDRWTVQTSDTPSGVLASTYLTQVTATSTYARVIGLAASNGTNDTTAIQAALTTAKAAPGSVVRGLPGTTYLISAPLVISSGTTLDMTGCTVRLNSGSNCNMLQNEAVATGHRDINAAMTSSSAVLTSSTAAFTTADVGKAIVVQGAGSSGNPLTTTVLSRQSATQITLTATASTTVGGQFLSIGTRDTDIAIVGGRWDRQNNNSTPTDSYDAHSIRFRQVDRVSIRSASFSSTGGKYAISVADANYITVRDIMFVATGSDGVHISGPARNTIIRDIMADTIGDDIVSLTCWDCYAVITDTCGDIIDTYVDGVTYRNTGLPTSSALKVVANQTTDLSGTFKVKNLLAKNLTCPSSQGVVVIGDNQPVGGNGGVFQDITVEGARSLGASTANKPVVYLRIGTMDRITLRDITAASNDTATVKADATINRLQVSDCHWSPSTTTAPFISVSGTITSLAVDGVQGVLTAVSSFIDLQSTAAITRLMLTRLDITGSSTWALIQYNTFTTASIGKIHMSNLFLVNCNYPLGGHSNDTFVAASQVNATGMTAWAKAYSTATVTLAPGPALVGDNEGLANDAGATILNRGMASGTLAVPYDTIGTGDETFSRQLAHWNTQLTTGTLVLTYFRGRTSGNRTNVISRTWGTASSAATLCRVGIYSVDMSGNLTLIASSASDTAMWSSTFTKYTKALSSTWAEVAGQVYAVGFLFVGTTGPKLVSIDPGSGDLDDDISPRLNGTLASQSDLPSSIATGSVTATANTSVYARFT